MGRCCELGGGGLYGPLFLEHETGLRHLSKCGCYREVFQVGYNLKKWKEAKRGGDSLMAVSEIKG